jgi:hypothetical protein
MDRSLNVLATARAEALFTSHLSAGFDLTRADVTDAIRRAIRAHGGTRGCAIEVAGEYGDHPETAALRMRWALKIVEVTYAHHRGTVESRLLYPEPRRLRIDGAAPGLRAAS